MSDEFKQIGEPLRDALSRAAGTPSDGTETRVWATAEKCIAGVASEYQYDARLSIEQGLLACESPIERLLLPHLVCQSYGEQFRGPARVALGPELPQRTGVTIFPQHKLPGARLDFAIVAAIVLVHRPVRWRAWIVECDGRDFHDVKQDRLRDASFGVLGVETVRCYGANIWQRADYEASRVALMVSEWADSEWGERE